MGVGQAPIQTVEEIYRLVWTSVANKQAIEAMSRNGIGCAVLTDWAGIEKDGFGACAINTTAKARADSSPAALSANWRCVVLEKLSGVTLVEDDWLTVPNYSVLPRASPKAISTRRIIPSAIRRKDREAAA